MKKVFSVLLAVLMISALCVPALAAKEEQAPIFNTSFTRVNNEPTVEYDEWDIPYNVWVPATTPFAVGDTATIVLSYSVPATVEGFDAKALSSIEYIVNIAGLTNIELVEAIGCPGKMECDYEAGFCMPIPGEYSNVTLTDSGCVVMAQLGSSVQVVLRGTVAEETINCTADITIGQYRFPAQYMIGTSVVELEKLDDGCYNAHRSDFNLVQKRDLAFRNTESGLCEFYPALNGHYYLAVIGDQTIEKFVPVDDNWQEAGEPVEVGSEMFGTLASIMEEYKELFGFDYNNAAINDEFFFDATAAQKFNVASTIQNGDTPVDPTTDAPVEPSTDAPVDPSNPSVPSTGAFSFVFLGIAAIAGAGIVVSRRKED